MYCVENYTIDVAMPRFVKIFQNVVKTNGALPIPRVSCILVSE